MSFDKLHDSVAYLRGLKEINYDLEGLTLEEKYLFLCLYALGFEQTCDLLLHTSKRNEIFSNLKDIDNFYREVGGVLGYQKLIIQNLFNTNPEKSEFFPPLCYDINQKDGFVQESILKGLESLPRCCEIYVVGGAADRLGFFDEESQEPLPAAAYEFLGKSLLKHLIDDLEAREFLYFQKYGKRILTPICLMTSDEKRNNQRIQKLIEENNYFGRGKETFYFIRQPMVPTVNEKGEWLLDEDLVLKPSGHGALWLSAIKQGVLENLKSLGYEFALVRQINNPIIGIDYNLLAFMGVGILLEKKFGFFATKRLAGQPEGVIVQKIEDGSKMITNVEYCAVESSELNENFPSNTNLLFVKLDSIDQAVKELPYPGCLLNFKPGKEGRLSARLELTMQNIAEFFSDKSTNIQDQHESVFVVSQERSKAISTIKKLQNENNQKLETPERAFFDLAYQIHILLKEYCHFQVPQFDSTFHKFFASPSYLFFYHPALGPEYEIISKKIKNWTIASGSYVELDIAQLKAFDILIDGGLIIEAADIYTSSCFLEKVQVVNQSKCFSELEIKSLNFPLKSRGARVKIGKNSQFIAKDSILDSAQTLIIPDNSIGYLIANEFIVKSRETR